MANGEGCEEGNRNEDVERTRLSGGMDRIAPEGTAEGQEAGGYNSTGSGCIEEMRRGRTCCGRRVGGNLKSARVNNANDAMDLSYLNIDLSRTQPDLNCIIERAVTERRTRGEYKKCTGR